MMGPPTSPAHWLLTAWGRGLELLPLKSFGLLNQSFAFTAVPFQFQIKSPWNLLVPDLVVKFMFVPAARPYCAV